MIRTLIRITWISLKRDRVALLLTFVLPLVFFSIFGIVFGGTGGDDGSPDFRPLDVRVLDADQSTVSRRIVRALDDQDALSVSTLPATADRDSAAAIVRSGAADAAIILPSGLGEEFGSFGGDSPSVEVIYDAANPMAQHTISGLLQAASFRAAPDVLMSRGVGYLETFGGPLTDPQQAAVDQARRALTADDDTDAAAADAPDAGFTGLISVVATSARTIGEPSAKASTNSMVAYYAAGIGVMFLLFSMTGAAGGLLEEEESGTLDRVLSTNVSMKSLLTARWFFFGVVGFLQVLLMFVWGALVFKLDLWTPNHMAGCIAMSAVTSAAAAAFGVGLATLCRSRAQLSGLSTIIILVMSAVGGSMMPRFIMPPFMDLVSKFTFNGWALDGFLKVFWYDDPSHSLVESVISLWPQLAVLSATAIVFLLLAFRFGRRWEAE